MRDPERLNQFYSVLCYYHQKFYPDWRFGQFIVNFLGAKGDPFYWEEDRFIQELYAWSKETFPNEAIDIKDILNKKEEP